MVSASGRYPTEDSSDEKDGSFDGCHAGTAKRRFDPFLCRRGSSDTDVLTRSLRREVSRPGNTYLSMGGHQLSLNLANVGAPLQQRRRDACWHLRRVRLICEL